MSVWQPPGSQTTTILAAKNLSVKHRKAAAKMLQAGCLVGATGAAYRIATFIDQAAELQLPRAWRRHLSRFSPTPELVAFLREQVEAELLTATLTGTLSPARALQTRRTLDKLSPPVGDGERGFIAVAFYFLPNLHRRLARQSWPLPPDQRHKVDIEWRKLLDDDTAMWCVAYPMTQK